ncbi:MAG: hypothetical protein PHI29_13225 [Gallionella sp.]|nr:hypothetical protein [Gallionella sp.]
MNEFSIIYALAAILGTALSAYLGWPDAEAFNSNKFCKSILRASPAAVIAVIGLPAAVLDWSTFVYIIFSMAGGAGFDVILKRAAEKPPAPT